MKMFFMNILWVLAFALFVVLVAVIFPAALLLMSLVDFLDQAPKDAWFNRICGWVGKFLPKSWGL
jgi:hypothetical protein